MFNMRLTFFCVVTLVNHRAVTTSNLNKITNNLMKKLGQYNEMFAKLQEMTNK